MADGARIPPYYAQRKMPTGVGAVKMDWPSFHAGRESAAIAEFGRAFAGVGDLAMKRLDAINQAEFTQGKADYSTAILTFQNQIDKDPNSDTYVAQFDKFFAKAERDILKGKSQAVSRVLSGHFKTQRGSIKEVVKKFAWQRKSASIWADTLVSVRKFEITGNAAKAEAALVEAMKIDPDIVPDAKAELEQVRANVDWYKGLQIVDRDPLKYIDMTEAETESRTVEVGPKFEFLTNLDPAKKMELYEKAKRLVASRAAGFKSQREVETNAEQGQLMRLLRTNKLTEEIITNSKLDEFGTGSKDTFYKMMDAKAEDIIADKKSPYTESDPVIEARMLDLIRDPDAKITPKDISELVGKGLSIDDASRMIDNLQVLSDPWFKRVDMYLKSQLGWDGAYEKFLHPAGGIAYKLASDKLFDAIETDKLRGKDIYERGSEIAVPFVCDYWEKALNIKADKVQSLRRMLEGEAKKPTKPEEVEELSTLLKKKPLDLLDPLGIFK